MTQQQSLAHQTFGQYSSDYRCNHCPTNDLSYNLPYEHDCTLPSHSMPVNIPELRYSTFLPVLNTTLPSLSFPNDMKKIESVVNEKNYSSKNLRLR